MRSLKKNHPHDDYTILVTLKADGTVEKTIVGSDDGITFARFGKCRGIQPFKRDLL